MESLNEHLPEINSDLIFKDNCVLFRPTYEELKHKYYQEIQKFITIPLRFLGVDNKKTDLFKLLPDVIVKGLKESINIALISKRVNTQRSGIKFPR